MSLAGRYRLIEPLGRGGMGSVWRAEHLALSSEVAVKIIDPIVASRQMGVERFLREAQALAQCRSAHVVQVLDFGIEGNIVYLVMELLLGRSLGQRLKAEGKLSLRETARIVREICKGVGHAHARGIVHRDLKPDNVFLCDETSDAAVKVLDFGIAKTALGEGAGSQTTEPGTFLGTPSYMSPEQCLAVKSADARSDLWAIGVIVYECLLGQRAFDGDSAWEIVVRICNAPPPVPSERGPVPAGFDRWFSKALARNADERFQSAEELAVSLGAILEAALDDTLLAPPAPAPAPLHAEPAPTHPPLARARLAPAGGWRRWLALAVGIASLAGATLFAMLARGPRPATEPVTPTPTVGVQAPEEKAVRDGRTAPTAVTDLPLPESASPEAIARYATAMQAIRDGNWGHVQEELERAVTLDPGLAAAQLRLAMFLYAEFQSKARGYYARAMLGRTRLSERDQLLLDAYEPLLYRDPPQVPELLKRLEAATARYPYDSELFATLALERSHAGSPQIEVLAAARRSAELDPRYTDAWQSVGRSLLQLGRVAEALEALDHCIQVSPSAADCFGQRGLLHGSQGRCNEMDADMRQAVNMSRVIWHQGRTASLFALGRPREAILEVYRNRWSQLPEADRELESLLDQSQLEVAFGSFSEAEGHLREAEQRTASDVNGGLHAWIAAGLVHIYRETNRSGEAARITARHLRRRGGWINYSDRDEMMMERARLHAGDIDRATFAEKRDTWLNEQAARGFPELLRFVWYADGVETPDEAREALALFPALERPKVLDLDDLGLAWFAYLEALAGRAREAIEPLETAVHSCFALYDPFLMTHAAYELGRALETEGEPVRACAAYEQVRARWGAANPASVTAGRARERTQALHCRRE
jgi:eukaryotic-like serine/threonine-protein kinase